jgi:hypothetical protein
MNILSSSLVLPNEADSQLENSEVLKFLLREFYGFVLF